MNISFPRFLVDGGSAMSAIFDDRISKETNQKIRTFQLLLTTRHIPGLIEAVPTYYTLMIHYGPCLLSYEELLQKLHALTSEIDFTALPSSKVLKIPVLYGGEMGLDLACAVGHAGISEVEVIKLHSESEYLTYMFGFAPSFTYLDGLNPKLETSHLEMPRVLAPAGSADIAGRQTGIYSTISPGGWQLIGRTPVHMYDFDREVPILPHADQYIHFSPTTEEEYWKIEVKIETGTYRLSVRKREEARA